jgi:hypothetical protein
MREVSLKSTNIQKTLYELKFMEDDPRYTGITVQGESPSSFKGVDTAHWLSKSKVEGMKGEGIQRLLRDPVIKDKDSADKMAEALLKENSRNLEGSIDVIGDPDIKIGRFTDRHGRQKSLAGR